MRNELANVPRPEEAMKLPSKNPVHYDMQARERLYGVVRCNLRSNP